MVRSKYLGQVYDNNWKVISVELAGRYGKRLKAKETAWFIFGLREKQVMASSKYSISPSHG